MINWKEEKKYLIAIIKQTNVRISKSDYTITINFTFNIKGSKSVEDAKEKAINFLS